MHQRARPLNATPVRPGGEYVLYWCQMNRRADANPALDFAVDIANQLHLPVLFYEGLTCTYPYASDRFHRFILEGVPETARRLAALGIGYTFYLRRRRSDPNDVLHRLAARAAAVVTDDYPTFIAARHNASVPPKLDIAFYAVDASCIVPMACFEKREYAAYTIRTKIHKLLPRYLWPCRRSKSSSVFRRASPSSTRPSRPPTLQRSSPPAKSITPCRHRSPSPADASPPKSSSRIFCSTVSPATPPKATSHPRTPLPDSAHTSTSVTSHRSKSHWLPKAPPSSSNS
jgi:deoxyribodipyrimidine photolyase